MRTLAELYRCSRSAAAIFKIGRVVTASPPFTQIRINSHLVEHPAVPEARVSVTGNETTAMEEEFAPISKQRWQMYTRYFENECAAVS